MVSIIGIGSATDLGTFKQNKNVTLFQLCSNCSYVKLTSINFPNGDVGTLNIQMDKDNYSYTHNFSDTNQIGEYKYSVCGDKNGIVKCETLSFEITPSGADGYSLSFFIILFILFYGLIIWGVIIKNEWITLAGVFGLLVLSVYTLVNGIGDFRGNLTRTISYINLLIGFGFGFETIREIIYY